MTHLSITDANEQAILLQIRWCLRNGSTSTYRQTVCQTVTLAHTTYFWVVHIFTTLVVQVEHSASCVFSMCGGTVTCELNSLSIDTWHPGLTGPCPGQILRSRSSVKVRGHRINNVSFFGNSTLSETSRPQLNADLNLKLQISSSQLVGCLSTSFREVHGRCDFEWWFLQRAAMLASAVLVTAIPSVCPSVCLSVTRRYCVKTTARNTVQFALSDSKMCLVL